MKAITLKSDFYLIDFIQIFLAFKSIKISLATKKLKWRPCDGNGRFYDCVNVCVSSVGVAWQLTARLFGSCKLKTVANDENERERSATRGQLISYNNGNKNRQTTNPVGSNCSSSSNTWHSFLPSPPPKLVLFQAASQLSLHIVQPIFL